MSESSKRRLVAGNRAQQQELQSRGCGSAQKVVAPEPLKFKLENHTLGERLKQLDSQNLRVEELAAAKEACQQVTSMQPAVIELLLRTTPICLLTLSPLHVLKNPSSLPTI
ncbi:hypothetical protein Pyn_25503 [Prunus yedoensis var. nudiflora]|uniref:Uncharacterized protein n=1 Tax=Prunus yedoensis var. nudiflora TaxID=2094558 RepID=A0A314YV93_PRUYE|nr:hypothetical protein Pyn_25503 [Prunus yedoensis var. nudiflora]